MVPKEIVLGLNPTDHVQGALLLLFKDLEMAGRVKDI
jgi:hypothetical protein